ncbi:hypothetical protein Tco_1122262 [Tanacetum coccineum]|uniref:Uncharacterized protein n=1 Tax=Tanacetum coccineum TaxID=301880 RepID=A0ABQ5J023_9ASTR
MLRTSSNSGTKTKDTTRQGDYSTLTARDWPRMQRNAEAIAVKITSYHKERDDDVQTDDKQGVPRKLSKQVCAIAERMK